MRHPYLDRLKAADLSVHSGWVRRVASGRIEATGPFCTIGDICEIEAAGAEGAADQVPVLAEVAAVEEAHVVLVPLDPTRPVFPDARVTVCPSQGLAPVGPAFGGRLIDALAQPLDSGGRIGSTLRTPLVGKVMAPLERSEPTSILQTGLRAIDGLLPIGRGQRIGIFAASGVGKTTLVSQLARQVDCDRCILCLVGERGREVNTLWRDLPTGGAADRFTCVAATSDVSATLRARAVSQALCLAEYWRSEGEYVLLIVDSVTRYAMALREIGLAAGEPPTLRAYTPNVFAALPRVVERCGGRNAGGSITAIMTVLSETDDVDDPIVEVMKSLLDGHVILSRTLAEQRHFPAIDVVKSVSRQSDALMSEAHQAHASKALRRLAVYEESRVMIDSGIYKPGGNARLDDAVSMRPALQTFLQQKKTENSSLESTLSALLQLSGSGG